jgi:histidyl-tRNA synthetase
MGNENIIQPRVLKGFRDYLPEEKIFRDRMITVIKSVFESFGFVPIETPALEYADILLGKYGSDAEKLIYRFRDNADRDVCLRYDLTVPLARFIAQYRDLPIPFKRYQIAPVWRAEKPQKGRFREFYQCDADIVGSQSIMSDFECIWVIYKILVDLNIPEFVIKINNRQLLNCLMNQLKIDSDKKIKDILRTIDKLPKIGMNEVKKIMATENELDDKSISYIESFLTISGKNNSEILDKIAKIFPSDTIWIENVNKLKKIIELSSISGIPQQNIVIDISIARGLDYYTGIVFETYIKKLSGVGSISSGGRFDTLIGLFTGENIPAVGISIGLDRLYTALMELKTADTKIATTDVMFINFTDELIQALIPFITELRNKGIKSEIYLDSNIKLDKQFKYANNKNIPFVVIYGPDEAVKNVVKIKDMVSGEQTEVGLTSFIQFISEKLKK